VRRSPEPRGVLLEATKLIEPACTVYVVLKIFECVAGELCSFGRKWKKHVLTNF
jgi:hypothetical protein